MHETSGSEIIARLGGLARCSAAYTAVDGRRHQKLTRANERPEPLLLTEKTFCISIERSAIGMPIPHSGLFSHGSLLNGILLKLTTNT